MNQTVADYIAGQLKEWGVSRIFGVAGSEIIPLMDALHNREIQFIAVRHESAAGFMAATEAKLTGKLGVCLTTAGPGLGNLLNGIADAAQDHVPVLVLSGQVPLQKIGTHAKQYINQQSLISPLALFSELATHPQTVPSLLLKAMQTAILQHGVTHLSLPVDIQRMNCSASVSPFPPFLNEVEMEIDPEAVKKAANLLSQAKKPLILIGGGARKAATLIANLAEKTGAGILASLGAKGILPGEHPCYLGGIGDGGSDEAHHLIQQCDLLLLIGCTWFPTQMIPENLPIIQIERKPDNLLLDKKLIHALIGKAERILPHLLEEISTPSTDDWKQTVHQGHQAYLNRLRQETALSPSNADLIHPARLIAAMETLLPEDCLIAVDTGQHTIWFGRYFVGKRHHVVFSGKWRSMGFALPAANAAKLLFPAREVIAVTGDGSLLMSAGELCTSVKYGLHVKVIVINDQSLFLEERKQIGQGYIPSGTSLTNPDFAAMARSFGWEGITLKNETDIPGVIQEVLAAKKPVLVDAHCMKDMPRELRVN